MIKKFVERFDAKRAELRTSFKAKGPESYGDLVRRTVEAITDKDEYGEPDVERITQIDHGDYQGTLLFVIAACGYQPSKFWYVKVDYGSCSSCDTLQGIMGYGNDVTNRQADEYLTLALHIVQRIKEMEDGE